MADNPISDLMAWHLRTHAHANLWHAVPCACASCVLFLFSRGTWEKIKTTGELQCRGVRERPSAARRIHERICLSSTHSN